MLVVNQQILFSDAVFTYVNNLKPGTIKYDPVKQQFIDDEGANQLINPPMRDPWKI